MNPPGGLLRSVRGTTEVIGVVVLVGMVVTSATMLFVFASDAQRGIENEIDTQHGIQMLENLDSSVSTMSNSDTNGSTVAELGNLRPSNMRVVTVGYVGVEADDTTRAFDGSTVCSARVPLKAVVVGTDGGDQLVYLAGGVWRVGENGASMVSPPEMDFDPDSGSFSFATYNFQGEFSDSETVLSENTAASQRTNERVREELFQNEACREELAGNLDNLTVTTVFTPDGSGHADTIETLVPAYERFVEEEFGHDAGTWTDASGNHSVRMAIDGEMLPNSTNVSVNHVVDFTDPASESTGAVDDATDSIAVDKDADNEYAAQVTLLATDVGYRHNVTEPVPDYSVQPIDAEKRNEVAVYQSHDVAMERRSDVPAPHPDDVAADELSADPEFTTEDVDVVKRVTSPAYTDVSVPTFTKHTEQSDGENVPPLDVVFVIDESGSMGDPVGDGSGQSKLDAAKDAAQRFVGVMPHDQGHRVAVVGYTSYWEDMTELHMALARDYDGANATIQNALEAQYSTPIGNGLDMGLDHLDRSGREDANQVIVLLSDGYNNAGVDPDGQIARAADDGVTIHSVGFGPSVGEDLLEDAANRTGGNYTYAANSEELDEAFSVIAKNETTRNVTVREPAGDRVVEMMRTTDEPSSTPANGVSIQYDGDYLTIRPTQDDWTLSMEDEDTVAVDRPDAETLYFNLTAAVVPDEPTEETEWRDSGPDGGSASVSATAAAGAGDVDYTHELRLKVSSTPIDDVDADHVYFDDVAGEHVVVAPVAGSGDTVEVWNADSRTVEITTAEGERFYVNVTQAMLPEPSDVPEWEDAGEVTVDVSVYEQEDRRLGDLPDPADGAVFNVSSRRVVVHDTADADAVYDDGYVYLNGSDRTLRIDVDDLNTTDPGANWVSPASQNLSVLTYDDPDHEPPSTPGYNVTQGSRVVYVAGENGGSVAETVYGGDTDPDEYFYTNDSTLYRFDASAASYPDPETDVSWVDDGERDLEMKVYEPDDDVPSPGEIPSYALNLTVTDDDGDTLVVVVRNASAEDSVSHGEDAEDETIRLTDAPPSPSGETETLRVNVTADAIEDARDDHRTVVADRQIRRPPMAVEVTVGGTTVSSPWTDGSAGVAADVDRVTAANRSALLTMTDGESMSFSSTVWQCDAVTDTGQDETVGDETYDRTRCVAASGVDSSASVEVHMLTDGDAIPTGDTQPWQQDLAARLGSQYVSGGEVNLSSNQVLVVYEYDDNRSTAGTDYNNAVVLVEVGQSREEMDFSELVDIDVNQVQIEEQDD